VLFVFGIERIVEWNEDILCILFLQSSPRNADFLIVPVPDGGDAHCKVLVMAGSFG
jgi:hypothetical protein